MMVFVHGASVAVREAAVVKHLEQHVPDVGVSLLHLVEQHDRVGTTPNGLGELAPLVIAHVARGRADESAHRVGLHVLRHVDADHGAFVVAQLLSERAGQLGLADARGSEEQE